MWADRGECKSSHDYMYEHCRPACGDCTPKPKRSPVGAASPAAAPAESPAGSTAGAHLDVTAIHAEQQKAAADANQAAADQATVEAEGSGGLASENTEADKAAAEKAEQEPKKHDMHMAVFKATAAAQPDSEEQLRAKHPTTDLPYPDLVKR